MKPLLTLVGAALVTLAVGGCGDVARGPYSSDGAQQRDIPRAAAIYQDAVEVIEKDEKKAEVLLREALGFDLYHGPAHNNLGVLLINQGKLYDAAEEFEWARKLLPGHPEPRVNLAIALERGGKGREAVVVARTALEVRPGDVSALQALTWIQIREGMADAQTLLDLDSIVMRCGDPHWKEWAKRQRSLLEAKVQR